MEKISLSGMTLDELQTVADKAGLARYAAAQIAHRLYRCHALTIAEMAELPAKKRAWLEERYHVGRQSPIDALPSTDGAVKYLFAPAKPAAGRRIETVFIPAADRGTLCLSSQLGCRMGCRFCMTGRSGFHGNLSPNEILNQLTALDEFGKGLVTNAVFMGMGEPMDNIEPVLKVLNILTAQWGYGWSSRRITVSTVGTPEAGFRRFLAESKARLAVSLHSPFAAERAEWVPAERVFPVKELIALLKKYDFGYQRRISFEYILFKGMNDSQAHVKELGRLLRAIGGRVNVIGYHPIPGKDGGFESPSVEQMEEFCNQLNAAGLNATLRASRGVDIHAACGLLSPAPHKKGCSVAFRSSPDTEKVTAAVPGSSTTASG
ncbi:MAG: radical SAM protein [Tannerellaceae bacterium]|jgi:23S rRNA (adenine2503-C2)-methyltransferase|nr:radical SAM protein [Tannerellaceae bacterium]